MKNKTIKTWGDRGDHNHMPGDDQSSTSRNLASRHQQNLPKSFEVPQKSSSFYLHENFFMESWFFYWSIPHGNLKFNTALAPENGWVGWRTIRRLPFWGPVHFQGTCFNFKGGPQHFPAHIKQETVCSPSGSGAGFWVEEQMFGAGKTRLKQGGFVAWTTTSSARQLRWKLELLVKWFCGNLTFGGEWKS